MSRYALILVGITAVLLAGALPGVDDCAFSAAPDHACCAEPAPEPTSSCCSSMEAADSRAADDHQSGCDCIHPPSTPADVVASNASPAPNDDTSPELQNAERHFALSLERLGVAAKRLVRIDPPPPAHLLNCSYLI